MLIKSINGENPPSLRTCKEKETPTANRTSSRTSTSDADAGAHSAASPAASNQGITSSSSTPSRFRLLFDAALVEKDDVLLLPLCEIFVDMSAMMSSWNLVFQVAVVDLTKKVERIRAAARDQPDVYRTMQTAAEHERAAGLKKDNGGITAILISLHRTMRFTIAFLDGIRRADQSVEMSTVARDAYSSTVARHHNWAMRKMTTSVMGSVPPRREMIACILRQDGNGVGEAEFFEGFLKRAEILRDRCDSILGKE